jgi:hypothetical protein
MMRHVQVRHQAWIDSKIIKQLGLQKLASRKQSRIGLCLVGF